MTSPVYRICRKCRQTWNVLKIDPGDRAYLCPRCDKQTRESEKARNENVSKKVNP